MTTPSTLLLHVADPRASAEFYRLILDREPVNASDAFVLFVLPSGIALGLWRRDSIEPAATGVSGTIEIGFKLDHDAVDACYTDWLAKDVAMLMAPTDRPFGRSFVALDPDGHRLRVYALND